MDMRELGDIPVARFAGFCLSLNSTMLCGCCKKCNNPICLQFSRLKDVLYMPGNSGLIPSPPLGEAAEMCQYRRPIFRNMAKSSSSLMIFFRGTGRL